MKDIWAEEETKKVNLKKLIVVIFISLVLILSITITTIYALNSDFRNWMDSNLLFKVAKQGSTVSIEFTEENVQAFAFDKYIVLLQKKNLYFYNNLGTKVATIPIEINNAMWDISGKYLVIAEENGQKMYVITGKEILWEAEPEEGILQVEINENGYVGVVTSDVSYKNIINVYDSTGKEILKTYLATTKVVDISISKDNKYLAISEVDMTGVLIQSNIKIISIEAAKTNPNDAIIYIYNADVNKLIINIEYQNKNRLVCMYNNSIDVIENEKNQTLVNIQDSSISFATVELNNNISVVEEKSSGDYTSDTYIKIIRVANKKEKVYKVEKVAKEIYSFEEIIGLNFGTELYIINKNGWLIKKYIANQEINDVIMSNKIVGIVYRNKIEILDI